MSVHETGFPVRIPPPIFHTCATAPTFSFPLSFAKGSHHNPARTATTSRQVDPDGGHGFLIPLVNAHSGLCPPYVQLNAHGKISA